MEAQIMHAVPSSDAIASYNNAALLLSVRRFSWVAQDLGASRGAEWSIDDQGKLMVSSQGVATEQHVRGFIWALWAETVVPEP
jgi:hypothetical protein